MIDGESSPQRLTNIFPAFTWQFNDLDPGDFQTKFQVIIGTVLYDEPEGQQTIFASISSGEITSGESEWIYDKPDPLSPGYVFYWQVRTTDGNGDYGPWSAVGSLRTNKFPIQPMGLLVDGRYAPRGIIGPAPEMSWTFFDYDEGDTQGAYRILVASSQDNIDAYIGDMWDSGKVFSSDTTVDYAGAPLAQGASYFWTAMVWDNYDSPSIYDLPKSFSIDTPPVAPLNPTVEGAGNPSLIYDPTPDFSWEFSDADIPDDPDERQGWYRILVAGSSQLLASDTGDMWDSGKTDSSLSEDITLSGSPLPGGATYFWKVMVWDHYDSAGPWSEIQAFSLPPITAPSFIHDGLGPDIDYQRQTDRLSANWDAVELASSCWYAFGTTAGGNDIVDWTQIQGEISVTQTGLALIPGHTYFASVKTQDAGGVFAGPIYSDGVAVDTDAPANIAFINDGVDPVDAQWTAFTTALSANWGASSDAQSGIAEYLYAIGTTSGGTDVVNWTSAARSTVITHSGLNLEVSWIYYFSVKAVNGAGLESQVITSNGITVVGAPHITSTAASAALVSRAFHYDSDDKAEATGTQPLTWSLFSGPGNFSIDPGTGLISWTPTVSGSVTIIIRAANLAGYDEQVFTVTVNGPVITSQPTSSAFVGLPYYYDTDNTAEAESLGTVTWRVISGPEGFTINPVTGLMAWIPDQIASEDITIRAQDEYSYYDQTFTVVVRALAIDIETGQINIVIVENITQEEADKLGDTYVFVNGEYEIINVTTDIDGPTPIIANPPADTQIGILPGLQTSYAFAVVPGWNCVPNPFEVAVTFTDFHFAFAAQGEESTPLSVSEYVSGYALLWKDGEYKRIPDQAPDIPAQSGFFVFSLAQGTLTISR